MGKIFWAISPHPRRAFVFATSAPVRTFFGTAWQFGLRPQLAVVLLGGEVVWVPAMWPAARFIQNQRADWWELLRLEGVR